MLHSKIQFDPDIAENVRLFNPFGPNMLYMSLNNNTIQKMLTVVNDLSNRQDIKAVSYTHLTLPTIYSV